MPKDFDRTRRVAEQIQRDLAQLIQFQIKDPRLGMVTVSSVEVSRDYSNAKVYVTVFNQDDNPKVALDILQHAAGFLRHELGQRLRLRTIPHLHFYYDESIARGAHLSALINTAMAKNTPEQDHEDEDGTEEK
jgi:ribosome-binding factor A